MREHHYTPDQIDAIEEQVLQDDMLLSSIEAEVQEAAMSNPDTTSKTVVYQDPVGAYARQSASSPDA